ncbi:uncharacterized protein LOC112269976 [Brachypodium distachyon]|uniref:Late embryogenesis abundant protein LEA-2 subgroup domain-containing protein n=1 Tax=Brachypodium distachyon TaxID=15368 RepID=I1H1I1_BRADI|nr:uncharacterized protein LOC112269976 [Brachypodium distachyon]KQK19824.1 hypothetical protein BRADI_1g50680v3 [Brachypodium distachyon]|eukprot:XP_024313318.1 uncharacterized protein LOC112269976 [Brachypodium distachyon]
MEEDDHGGKRQYSRVRLCIDAVRYVVTLLMLVAALGVTVGAFAVSLRSEKLFVEVADGHVSVSASSNSSSPSDVTLSFSFNWINPSGRAGIQYSGIKVGLFLNGDDKEYSLSDPPNRTYSVPPKLVTEVSFLDIKLDELSPVPSMALVRRLQRTTKAKATTLVSLSGRLRTQVTGGLLTELKYTREVEAKYVCAQVTVGDGGSPQRQLQDAAQNVRCTESSQS